jgi:hypothetical protein
LREKMRPIYLTMGLVPNVPSRIRSATDAASRPEE